MTTLRRLSPKPIIDVEFALERFNGFSLYQRQFTLNFRRAALVVEIAIAFQAATGNGAHFIDRLHRRFSFGCDVD